MHKYFLFKIRERYRIFIMLLCVICGIVSTSYYFKYDKIGSYYGCGSIFYNTNLPFNIKPGVNYFHSLILFDEDNFELVDSGFYYTDFMIKKFDADGYNTKSLILSVKYSLNRPRYMMAYKSKGKDNISFRNMDAYEYKSLNNNYQWVMNDKEYLFKIESIKFYCLVGTILPIIFMWYLLRLIRKKVILIACALLCIVGCQKNIVERNAIEISVENLKNNQIRKVVNENEIVTITDKINSSEKDFLIFKPDVKLVFTYSNGNKKIVLVKKNMLKIDGISYINKSDNDYLPFNF